MESRYSGVLEGWLEDAPDDDHHDEHTLELKHHVSTNLMYIHKTKDIIVLNKVPDRINYLKVHCLVILWETIFNTYH